MKTTLALLLGLVSTVLGEATLPSKAAVEQYAKELDHLQRYCLQTACFSDERFWRESARLARRTGPEIIHAVLLRGRGWREEEGLVFVPLMAFLPRAAATKLLRQYQRSPRASDRLYAHEFLIELDASDTKEMVTKLSRASQ